MSVRRRTHFGAQAYFIFDYAAVAIAVRTAYALSPRFQGEVAIGSSLLSQVTPVTLLMPLFCGCALYVAGLQRTKDGFRAVETTVLIAAAMLGGICAFCAAYFLVRFGIIGRYIIGLTWVFATIIIAFTRFVLWTLAERSARTVVILGSEVLARDVRDMVAASRLPIRIEHVDIAAEGADLHELFMHRLGDCEIVLESGAQLPSSRKVLLLDCVAAGLSVVDANLFHEQTFGMVYVAGITESWLWGYDPNYSHPVFAAFKRGSDLILSMVGLILSAPIMAVIVATIKCSDGGPAIYKQERVGLYGRPFTIYKFRSMRMDAEASGAKWAGVKDPRVTPVGRFLRKSRLDETPQFWNILRGDMSFIGPRPERPEFTSKIDSEIPLYRYRHLVKPGLTGWAQINYPYGASIEDARKKLAFDLYYIKHASMLRDISVVLRTMVAMARGAR